jgi:hypothetical protein
MMSTPDHDYVWLVPVRSISYWMHRSAKAVVQGHREARITVHEPVPFFSGAAGSPLAYLPSDHQIDLKR